LRLYLPIVYALYDKKNVRYSREVSDSELDLVG